MTMRFSKALFFGFVTLLAGPAVSVAQDHIIEVSTDGNKFFYKHQKGLGAKGNVVIQSGYSVQWHCKNGDKLCKELLISFPNTSNPCGSSALGPASLVTCDNIDPSIFPNIPYATQVCDDQGHPLALMEDPEFIVDGGGGYKRTSVLVLLALLLGLAGGIFGGRWFGKARTS